MGAKRLRWIVLALYVALTWALIGLRLVPTFSTISVWDAQSTETLVKWGRHLLFGGGAWAFSQIVERESLTFTPVKVTSAEKRRLVNLLREGGQRDAEMRCLQLTEYDVNLLLNWGLSIGSDERKAKVVLRDGEVLCSMSIALPWGGSEGSYLNAQTSGHLAVSDGRLEFSLQRLRLGRLEIPQLILDRIARTVVKVLKEDTDLGEIVRSTERLAIKPGVVEIIARRGLFEDPITHRLGAQSGAQRDVALATRDYVRHLVDAAPKLPRGDQRFLAFVHAAFQLARDRSAHAEADPVLENRAAILALGILLGHPRVEYLVGNVTDDELRRQARRSIGRVTLRSRHDWTQHFWVSAAIALMSNHLVSDAIGLLKEGLDAGRSGSGFSFADLLADMAGTRFALYVTRDAKTARAAQKWLAGEVTVDQLFPPAADLPEGIRDARLQADYGGVGGAGYRKMIAELERRLQSCRFGE